MQHRTPSFIVSRQWKPEKPGTQLIERHSATAESIKQRFDQIGPHLSIHDLLSPTDDALPPVSDPKLLFPIARVRYAYEHKLARQNTATRRHTLEYMHTNTNQTQICRQTQTLMFIHTDTHTLLHKRTCTQMHILKHIYECKWKCITFP